jgi:hypothetical protein
LKLGWANDDDGMLLPVLSEVQAAPEAVVELLRCNCTVSRCASQRCTCKQNQLACTELCKCEASEECFNSSVAKEEPDSQ